MDTVKQKLDAIFPNIFGHDHAKQGLIHAAQTDHLHHALLFSGPSGIGKAQIARAFVQAIFCKNSAPQKLQRCNACTNCLRIHNQNFPDFIEIEPPSNSLKIETIRELQSRLTYAPYESEKRFVILHDVHKMQEAAANCFLKTLEEPPNHTNFILITDQIQRLIPTIVSRCQLVRFAPFSMQDALNFLASKNIPSSEAAQIAVMCGGSLGLALELSSSDYKIEVLQAFEDMLKTESMLSAFSVANLLKGKKDKANALLKLMHLYIRDMLVLKTSPNSPIILAPYQDRMRARCQQIATKDLYRAANVLQEVAEAFQGNVNELLAWERLTLGMHNVLF